MIGSWLGGPSSAGLAPAPPGWRGQRLGRPAEGAGAVASFSARLGALLVDLFLGALIGRLVDSAVGLSSTSAWQGIVSTGCFAVMVIVLVSLTGQTIGMRLVGVRVVALAGRPVPALGWTVVRTVLLCLLVPAVIWDRDNRGLHDRAAGTVVVRT